MTCCPYGGGSFRERVCLEGGGRRQTASYRADLALAAQVNCRGQVMAVANHMISPQIPRLAAPVASSEPSGRQPAASDTQLKQPSGGSWYAFDSFANTVVPDLEVVFHRLRTR